MTLNRKRRPVDVRQIEVTTNEEGRFFESGTEIDKLLANVLGVVKSGPLWSVDTTYDGGGFVFVGDFCVNRLSVFADKDFFTVEGRTDA